MLDDLNQKNHLRRFIREGASATTASARATSESWLTEIQKEGIKEESMPNDPIVTLMLHLSSFPKTRPIFESRHAGGGAPRRVGPL